MPHVALLQKLALVPERQGVGARRAQSFSKRACSRESHGRRLEPLGVHCALTAVARVGERAYGATAFVGWQVPSTGERDERGAQLSSEKKLCEHSAARAPLAVQELQLSEASEPTICEHSNRAGRQIAIATDAREDRCTRRCIHPRDMRSGFADPSWFDVTLVLSVTVEGTSCACRRRGVAEKLARNFLAARCSRCR